MELLRGLQEIHIIAKSLLYKSCIFSSKQGSTILIHFLVAGGGLIKFPSGRMAILKPCSNFSRASLREGLAGRKVETHYA